MGDYLDLFLNVKELSEILNMSIFETRGIVTSLKGSNTG